MPQYTQISSQAHKDKHWIKPSTYSFASGYAVVPVNISELPQVVSSMPVYFSSKNSLIALMGLKWGENLFVDPRGNWRGGYIPAQFRAYPFSLQPTNEQGDMTLCIDQEYIVEPPDGYPFFDQEGNLSNEVQEYLEFVKTLETHRRATQKACSALAEHGLIQSFTLQVKGVQNLEGLSRVDEKALHELDPQALANIRDVGGLKVAYCHLVSMVQINVLGRLYNIKQQEQQEPDIEQLFGDDATLNFDNI